jgi:hypothetical protein
MMKPSIVKIRKVCKLFEKFVNAVRSLTRQNSLPSSARRVVVKICDKASAKLEEAGKESLICLDALEMLPVQDYQPRIRFRLDDAVTVLKTIEHVDNQQLGNFSQRDMEKRVNAKVQISKQHLQRRCKLCLPLSRKQLKILLPLPLQTTKQQQPMLKKPKVLRSEKSDVIVQIIVATADRMITCGAQMLIRIQALMRVRSKNEGRMNSLLIQMPRGMRGPSISDRVFETAGAVVSSASGRRPILRLVFFTSVSS